MRVVFFFPYPAPPPRDSFHHYNNSINERSLDNVKQEQISSRGDNLPDCFDGKMIPQRCRRCRFSFLPVWDYSAQGSRLPL